MYRSQHQESPAMCDTGALYNNAHCYAQDLLSRKMSSYIVTFHTILVKHRYLCYIFKVAVEKQK